MPRSPLASLADIVDACEAIESFLEGIGPDAYRASHLTRSAVERQLILIGEAVGSLLRLDPSLSERISHARRIVDFRNLLTHDYTAVNDTVVWAIATGEVTLLREECRAILAERDPDRAVD
jgi:uncharacterized protein with HEPN domain